MTSEGLGLIDTYRVERTDGKPVGPCFVLEYDKDPLAAAPLLLYAYVARHAGWEPRELESTAYDLTEKQATVENALAPTVDSAGLAYHHLLCYLGGDLLIEQVRSTLVSLRDVLNEHEDRASAKLQAALMAFDAAEPEVSEDTGNG